MTRHVRVLTAGTALALGMGLLAAVGNGSPADDPKADPKYYPATLKIADLMGKKDLDNARTEAAALAKKVDDINQVMTIMAMRSKGGLGFGPEAWALAPDGLEARLINLGRRVTTNDLDKQGADLERMCDIMAAVAEVAIAKTPTKKVGKKDPKDWQEWSKQMRDNALALKEAIHDKKAPMVKDLATKLNGTCTDCHAIWKEK